MTKEITMKYALVLLGAFVLAACDNTTELAPENMKKGDQYFASRDYDIAEYYYEKIPEESPLYKEAQLKLQKIEDLQKLNAPKISMEDESQKVSIFEKSITSNPLGKAPVHTVALNNESVHKLTSVVLEFTYFDADGNVITVKRVTLNRTIPGKSQETFTDIAPGVLDMPCTVYKLRVLSAEFQ